MVLVVLVRVYRTILLHLAFEVLALDQLRDLIVVRLILLAALLLLHALVALGEFPQACQ